MARDVREVTLGLGVLEVDSADVGFLKDEVSFGYESDIADFQSDIPLTTLKRVRTSEAAMLSATIAQINAVNLEKVASAGTVTDSPTQQILEVGGESLVPDFPIVFTHTKDDGKVIEITLFKASSGNFELPFAETDFVLYDIEFTAIADTTKPKGKNLFKARIEKPAS